MPQINILLAYEDDDTLQADMSNIASCRKTAEGANRQRFNSLWLLLTSVVAYQYENMLDSDNLPGHPLVRNLARLACI
jgi:hypothetical protein